jgi:hypothetical protein
LPMQVVLNPPMVPQRLAVGLRLGFTAADEKTQFARRLAVPEAR